MRLAAHITLDKVYGKTRVEDDCLVWTGPRARNGYGRFTYFENGVRKTGLAHRVAWCVQNGDPGSGCVLHRCDNPPCVKIEHLRLGTNADNTADMMAKGRGKFPGAPKKLDGTEVGWIRKIAATGKFTQAQIASVFKVDQSTVSRAIRGDRRFAPAGGPL